MLAAIKARLFRTKFQHQRSTDPSNLRYIGPASGKHCQTYALYLFPLKQNPSTALALAQAKQSQDSTLMLTDLSISDVTQWGIGYAKRCILVTADAYGK